MNKPVAFQIAPMDNMVLYRSMDQAAYDAYMNNEGVDDSTQFTAFDIPEGFEIANIVVPISGKPCISIIRKE